MLTSWRRSGHDIRGRQANHPSRLDNLPTRGVYLHVMQTNDSGQLPRVLPVLEMLTEEELVQLNHIVVARLRLMQQIRAHGAMTQFRIGQRVRFTNSAGQMVRGVLSRFNRKTVTIITDCGHEWRVSPSLVVAE